MHKQYLGSFLFIMVMVGIFAVWRVAIPAAAKVEPAGSSFFSSSERWNLGITVEGPPTYNAILGRLVSDVSAFRSARATQGAMIFPAPAISRTVDSASFYLLSRSGTYTDTATLSLAIYDYAGTLQHIVSAADVDLQTASTGVWTPVSLSSVADNLVITPGEFLAFRFVLNGAAAGDLDVRPIFEVDVK